MKITEKNIQEVEAAIEKYYADLAAYFEHTDSENWKPIELERAATIGMMFSVRFEGAELETLLKASGGHVIAYLKKAALRHVE